MYFVIYLRTKLFIFSHLPVISMGVYPEEKKRNSDTMLLEKPWKYSSMQHFLLILYAMFPYKTIKAYILEFHTSIMAGLP